MKDFFLKDELRHKAYSWPQTVLHYEFDGNAPDPDTHILCRNGEEVPFQSEKIAKDRYKLTVLTDLPYLKEYSFCFSKGKSKYQALHLDNGIISVQSVKGGLYRVVLKSGEVFSYEVCTKLALLREEENFIDGQVENIITKTLIFEGDRKYEFTLKLKRSLDYLEIYEHMEGFSEAEAELKISWENFCPRFRYTLDRGTEPVDAYLKQDGAFPFYINPFAPRASFWDQRYVSYWDKKRSVWQGLCLHDLSAFDDGEYALWASNNTLAFSLFENKIIAPIRQGKRAFMHIFRYGDDLKEIGSLYFRYYSIVSLDKVKDYVLNWDSDKNAYPKYFKQTGNCEWGGFYNDYIGDEATPEDMMNILDRDSVQIGNIEQIAPVSARAYRGSWAETFDRTASKLNDDQFSRVKAAMAFVCYTFADENYYPIENMLAGHPNFLTDILGTIGVFAAILGKEHPMYEKWLEYYEIGLARNFKYHIRPALKDSLGGRWTENVGCYMFGMLHCIITDCNLIYRLCNRNPILYPHAKALYEFLVNQQTPENAEGRRVYMPQGAHSATGEFGGSLGHGYSLCLMQLADMLKFYEPLCAEYLLYNFRDQNNFDAALDLGEIKGVNYRRYAKNDGGTPPDLTSAKYTGQGFLLRDHAGNAAQEMCVFLQQIDEGPNYRWGRAAQGGCGEIYYYANRKKYTDHAPEDVGDENRGDVQSCTNFGVLVGHEFRSVGRNELNEPLIDFDFIKYARVNAGEYSYPYYKYRSVMMVENRYIAVYDAVGDARQRGRFVWSQSESGDFPKIWNLCPGVNGVAEQSGLPVDVVSSQYSSKYKPSKQMVYDGWGDFFTVVSHLRDYNDEPLLKTVKKSEGGAEIVFPLHKEYVFDASVRTETSGKDYSFDGYVGYAANVKGEVRLAVFDGKEVFCDGFGIRIPYDKKVRHAMSALRNAEGISGRVVFQSGGCVSIIAGRDVRSKIWLDGEEISFSYEDGAYRFEIPKGEHSYQISEFPVLQKVRIDRANVRKEGFDLYWDEINGADGYDIFLGTNAKEFKFIGNVKAETGENSYSFNGLADGKYFVKICAVKGERKGEHSHPYPVYVNKEIPHCPEGLRIEEREGGYKASWGAVLGAGSYRLYQKNGKHNKVVYEGKLRSVRVDEGEYFVTAINGNGESLPSEVRTTYSRLAKWDHHPEKKFIRDTRSNEHGYSGFDYVNNQQKPVLKYDDEEQENV